MIEPRSEILAVPRAVHGGPSGARDEQHPVRLDFSASLNAWGPAEVVLEAIRSAPVDRYPDPESLATRRAAAERWQRPLEEIAFGAGAAELLQALCFALLRPADRVLIPTPTFGEYARASLLCGARPAWLPASPPAWRLDAERLAGEVRRVRPRLVFLCAPNNPTGQALTRGEIALVADACQRTGALLVLDQSYDAFQDEPLGSPALAGHPAVLSLRSITKDHALAGVRAAFATGPARLIEALERGRVPWAASTLAQAAAIAALSPAGEAHARRTIAALRAERVRLEGALSCLGIGTVATATHFVLAEVGDASGFAATLRARHAIAVRDCTSFGLPAHIRVAARTPAENDALTVALEAECSS